MSTLVIRPKREISLIAVRTNDREKRPDSKSTPPFFVEHQIVNCAKHSLIATIETPPHYKSKEPSTMVEIELFQFPGLEPGLTISPPCWKVHLACKFKGQNYQVYDFTTPIGINKKNPRGRMPAATIKGKTVVDSSDILTALDEAWPEPSLLPANPRDRALVRILEDWADENLYFYAVYLRWLVPENRAHLKEHFFKRNYPALTAGIVVAVAKREVKNRCKGQGVGVKGQGVVERELFECFDVIETMLTDQDWLVGQQLTRADISVFAIIDQLGERRLTPKIAEKLDQYPQISAWRQRMAERCTSLQSTKVEEAKP